MAWAGEYCDDEDDDFNGAPIEEILVVTREDQEMLSEAHKALRREIKSIRKALKKMVRQFYDYADAQESTAPEWSDVSSVAESDIQIAKGKLEIVSDFATDSEFDQNENKKLEEIRNHSETESLQDIDEVQLEKHHGFDFDNENEQVKSQYNLRNRRRPDSTPPMIESSYSDHKSQDFRTKHRRHLGRSSTKLVVTENQNFTATTLSGRSVSRNSNSPDSYSAAEDNEVITNINADPFNNTYPGASPYHPTSQTVAKSLRHFGRRNAQHHFSSTDFADQSTKNTAKSPRSVDIVSDDNKANGQLPHVAEQKVPGVRRPPLQRRFTQEEIRQAGSQLRFPTTNRMRRKQTNPQTQSQQPVKHLDEPPPSAPPPPPSKDNSDLPGMEDQLGVIPEFSNSFQALPRRLSSSEISAIGGEKHSHHIPIMKKLIRNASHPITVTEAIAT